jgi:hypothetical protein
MKKLLLSMALLGMVLVGCSSPQLSATFPPPEGYSSWDEYNASHGKAETSSAPAQSTIPTTSITPTALTEIEYLHLLSAQSDTMQKSFEVLGILLDEPQLADAAWRDLVQYNLDIIQQTAAEVLMLVAPEKYKEVHIKYMEGNRHYIKMCEYLQRGLDDFDTEMVNKSNEEAYAGMNDIMAATDLIESITNSR